MTIFRITFIYQKNSKTKQQTAPLKLPPYGPVQILLLLFFIPQVV